MQQNTFLMISCVFGTLMMMRMSEAAPSQIKQSKVPKLADKQTEVFDDWPNYYYTSQQQQQQQEQEAQQEGPFDELERYAEPDERFVDKRTLLHLNRMLAAAAEAEEQAAKPKRSAAIARTNFRPAKRSAATGRVGFRPAKRSAPFQNEPLYQWI